MQTKLIIEQHFHGCFGIDFNKASVDDVLYLSKEILNYGIGGIFPTLVTDSVENIKKATAIIREAAQKQTPDMAKILGIHLEGIFINPEKKGIHNPEHFLTPTIENYKLVENDFIKIVTLAPEMISLPRSTEEECKMMGGNIPSEKNLISYLRLKNIKVQAGHCVGGDLTGCTGVTHLFNAMSGITHRGESTALSALVNDNIYTEVIGDGIHVSDDALRLVFKSKPLDKIILISDSLPITGSNLKEMIFADEKVYYDGIKATSKEGTIAGSTTMISKIIKRLTDTIFSTSTESVEPPDMTNSAISSKWREKVVSQLILNPYNYHNIDLNGSVEWDDNFNIIKVNKK